MSGDNGGTALWRVLGLVEHVRQSGSGYEASCPVPRHKHDDKHPSLSIGTGQDGRVLLNCKAGCEVADILAALGIGWADLFERSSAGNPVRRFRVGTAHANGTVVIHEREDLANGDKAIRWQTNGRAGLNGIKTEDLLLYRAGDVEQRPNEPVIVCEGEKAAEALVELGLLAVGTVTGAGGTPSAASLAVLIGREVWLWPDKDEPGITHMQHIAERLETPPRWIDWPAAPAGGDGADYASQGGTAAGVRELLRKPTLPAPVPEINGIIPNGPKIWTGPQLAAMAFDAPRWAIPNLLPAGLAILGGRPKLGKSWLALGWALDIPRPGLALRQLKVVQGETLYLALEDGPRRMQERQMLMLGDMAAPAGFHVVTEWPRTNEGGLELLDKWLSAHPDARMVVIDTFKRIRPVEKNTQRLYDLDYDAITPLADLARQHNVAIVLVFHTRKMQSDDPLEMISGTLGVSGAADAVLVLRRERGQADASLFVTGRDVEEQDLALRWNTSDTLGWELLGNADQFRLSAERRAILDTIEMVPGMTPMEIAEALDRTKGSIRKLLFHMVRDGEVRERDRKYYALARAREVTGNAVTPNLETLPPPSSGAVTVMGSVTQSPTVPTTTAVTDVTAFDHSPPIYGANRVNGTNTDLWRPAVLSPGNTRGAVCAKCARPLESHSAAPTICEEWEEYTPS